MCNSTQQQQGCNKKCGPCSLIDTATTKHRQQMQMQWLQRGTSNEKPEDLYKPFQVLEKTVFTLSHCQICPLLIDPSTVLTTSASGSIFIFTNLRWVHNNVNCGKTLFLLPFELSVSF